MTFGHIIQLAFVIVDIDSGKIIDSSNKLIKISDDVIIPEESIKVHVQREVYEFWI